MYLFVIYLSLAVVIGIEGIELLRTDLDSSCVATSFLNYVSIQGSPTYCVINRKSEPSKHRKCILMKDLWTEYIRVVNSTEERKRLFNEAAYRMSYFELMITHNFEYADFNKWNQLFELPSGLSVTLRIGEKFSVPEYQYNSSIPSSFSDEIQGHFARPVSICKRGLLNSAFDLTNATSIIDCPIVKDECLKREPKRPISGLHVFTKYEEKKATKCLILSPTPNQCITIEDAKEVLRNYNGTAGNYLKNAYSEALRMTYDGNMESFQALSATKTVVEALNTFNKVLGLKENDPMTFSIGNENVTIGEITFCIIVSLNLPLSDEQFDNKLKDC